ncbi:unnamed protein product [Effrenium voratum]|nr:unnamed protein product [Effrenium voratum]
MCTCFLQDACFNRSKHMGTFDHIHCCHNLLCELAVARQTNAISYTRKCAMSKEPRAAEGGVSLQFRPPSPRSWDQEGVFFSSLCQAQRLNCGLSAFRQPEILGLQAARGNSPPC